MTWGSRDAFRCIAMAAKNYYCGPKLLGQYTRSIFLEVYKNITLSKVKID